MRADTVYLPMPDDETFRDFSTFTARAKRFDDAGAVRLAVNGTVLAVTVAPLFATGSRDRTPTVLGMRIMQLADATADGLDVVVGLAAMTDRFARGAPADLRLPVPPTTVDAAWADEPPPRGGWQRSGQIDSGVLMAEANENPVARGSAQVADGLGFLDASETAEIFTAGQWQRISTRRGHVLTRAG